MAATVMRMSSSTEFFNKMSPAFPSSPSSASTSSASLSTTAALLSQLGCATTTQPNESSQSDASATSLLFLSSVADSSSDMSEEDDDGDDSSSSSSWSGDDMLSPPSPTMCSSPTCNNSNCNDHDHLDQFSYSSKKSSCTSPSSSSHKKNHLNNPSLLQYYQSLMNKPEGSSFKLKRKRTRPPMPTEVFCRICMVKSTPEWRRGPDGYKSLCNACGLRFAQMLRRERMLPTPDQSSLEKVKINALLN